MVVKILNTHVCLLISLHLFVASLALLDVPNSLEQLLKRLHDEGYNVGDFATDPDATGQSLVAALSILCQDQVIAAGVDRMQQAVEDRMARARNEDETGTNNSFIYFYYCISLNSC